MNIHLDFKSVSPYKNGKGFFVVARVGLVSSGPKPGSQTESILLHIADVLQHAGYTAKHQKNSVCWIYDNNGYVGSLSVNHKENGMTTPSRFHYMVTEAYYVNVNAIDALRQRGFSDFVGNVLNHHIYKR